LGHAGGGTLPDGSLLNEPFQRAPTPTLFRYGVQSVSACDHSPQMVGPKLVMMVRFASVKIIQVFV
jgi:hypothetical protein